VLGEEEKASLEDGLVEEEASWDTKTYRNEVLDEEDVEMRGR